MSGRSIVIIGGGASGILLASHLLRSGDPRLRVTLVEKRGELGRGLAFSASRADHILNVPASRMSAYDDQPDHFRDWLRRARPDLPDDPFLFAPRAAYGAYLGDVLREAAAGKDEPRLIIVPAQCVALVEHESGVEARLADGTSILAAAAVLAVGHEEQPARGNGIAVRADSDADTPLPPDAPVMILGSGLSMVDAWLSLSARRHKGTITIVSRHGLLPLDHAPLAPFAIDAADVPFGTSLHYLTRWFRDLVAEAAVDGGDWRSVVDGIRPYNQRLWQSWTPRTRRQFLEHVRPFWNIHRHRLPPSLHARMVSAIASDQVRLIAGHVRSLDRVDGQIDVGFRRKRAANDERLRVSRVYDCGGVTLDVTSSSNPLILSLLAQGRARPDEQRIGLDVTPELAVVAGDGAVSDRLFAVGPLTRGQFFEIEAIPDIRRQVAALAKSLA